MTRKSTRYTILQADAFASLAQRRSHTIQAVITDPPYGLIEFSAKELAKRKNGKGIWRLPQEFDGHPRQPMPRFTVLTISDHRKIRLFKKLLERVFENDSFSDCVFAFSVITLCGDPIKRRVEYHAGV